MTTSAATGDTRWDRATSTFRNWAARDSNGALLLGALLLGALYLYFWPASFTSMDEASYINMAAVLRHGTLYPDVAGIPVVTAYPVAHHLVSKYPLGMPTLLALTSLLGWHFALGTNLLVHLLTFLVVIRLLRRMDIPAGYALLFLLFPTAVLYSRTLMADPLSGLLLALAFDRHLARRPWATGLLVGASVLVRTGNVLAVPVFLAATLIEDTPGGVWRTRLADCAKFCAAVLPFGLGAWYYARVIAGGQIAQHTGMFGLGYFPGMFSGYALGLMLIYPGMLLAPALYRGKGWPVIAGLCYGFLLLYSFWYYRDQGTDWEETLIVGQRYFLAALPLWVIAYAALCQRVLARLNGPVRPGLSIAVTLMLFGLAGVISHKHQVYVSQLAAVRTELLGVIAPNDLLISNFQVAKLFYPGAPAAHVFVTGDVTSPENLQSVRNAIHSALRTPNTKVYVAAWVRPGRNDDLESATDITRVVRLYHAVPIAKAARKGLDPHVEVYEIR